eukprot:gi/632989695/ref/XP_007883785.1/ PREDICTED: uncharacterized protein LOC103172899 [Callorhinchus milii]
MDRKKISTDRLVGCCSPLSLSPVRFTENISDHIAGLGSPASQPLFPEGRTRGEGQQRRTWMGSRPEPANNWSRGNAEINVYGKEGDSTEEERVTGDLNGGFSGPGEERESGDHPVQQVSAFHIS